MKNKVSIIFILQSLILFKAVADSSFMAKKFYNTDEYGYVYICEDKIEFENCVENGNFLSAGKLNLFKGSGRNYIILHYKNENEEYMTLVSKTNSKSDYGYWEMTYSNSLSKKYNSSKLVGFNVKKTDDYVVEKKSDGKDVIFRPEDIFNVFSNPWAVKKESKDKSIYLTDERYCVPGCCYADIEEIIFINGFVSPDKPHLYEQNSRAKNVRISYGNVSFVATLADSGDYQSVKLPSKIKRESNATIKVEVLDSYEGTKYSDIVITGILYIDAELN